MTTKRTMGQCTLNCASRLGPRRGGPDHLPDCPALYPLQRQPGDEKDALARLVALVRMGPESGSIAHRDVHATKCLDLISEAREEHRTALREVGQLITALEAEKAQIRESLLATQKRMGEVRQQAIDEGREQGHLDAFLWLRAHHKGILAPTADDMRAALAEMMDAK